MGARPHAHHEKVKVTIECTADERAYIKMLAARAHLTLSDLLLSYVRTDFPKKPNRETLKAHEEALSGGGVDCDDLADFWEQMGVNPSALDKYVTQLKETLKDTNIIYQFCRTLMKIKNCF